MTSDYIDWSALAVVNFAFKDQAANREHVKHNATTGLITVYLKLNAISCTCTRYIKITLFTVRKVIIGKYKYTLWLN